MEFEHEFIGSEFGWVAIDAEGFIGDFCIAGTGPIPLSVLANAALFEDVYERALKLAEIGGAIPNPVAPGVTYHWERLAKRGLFAYDWNDVKRCYQIISRPKLPIQVDVLRDPELANLARMTILPLRFKESETIDPTVVP